MEKTGSAAVERDGVSTVCVVAKRGSPRNKTGLNGRLHGGRVIGPYKVSHYVYMYTESV